jgi:hypothetical protein
MKTCQLEISDLVFAICLGFDAWDLEFLRSAIRRKTNEDHQSV